MPKEKKATSSRVLIVAKSVRRTRSRRMKFCVHGGLGDTLNKQHRKPNGYPGALLADIISKIVLLPKNLRRLPAYRKLLFLRHI